MSAFYFNSLTNSFSELKSFECDSLASMQKKIPFLGKTIPFEFSSEVDEWELDTILQLLALNPTLIMDNFFYKIDDNKLYNLSSLNIDGNVHLFAANTSTYLFKDSHNRIYQIPKKFV